MKSRASANPPKAADLSFLKEVQYGGQADQAADPADAESAGKRRNCLFITFSRLVWKVSDQMICIVRFRSGDIFRTRKVFINTLQVRKCFCVLYVNSKLPDKRVHLLLDPG